jgi:hypothetical protein
MAEGSWVTKKNGKRVYRIVDKKSGTVTDIPEEMQKEEEKTIRIGMTKEGKVIDAWGCKDEFKIEPNKKGLRDFNKAFKKRYL